MELTLNIPDSLVKKIKALSALEGGSPGNLEKKIVEELDVTISNKIMHLVSGGSSHIVTANFRGIPSPIPVGSAESELHLNNDYLPESVAAGLGDTDDSEEDDDIGKRIEDTYGMVPETGGLTDEELDRDMLVEDPTTEAISSDRPQYDEDFSLSAEALFSSNLDLPPPPASARDPRLERREKHYRNLARTRKAKVSNIIGEPR